MPSRHSAKGTHGGHNGLRSIQDHLGTTEYARLRVGVGGPKDDAIDHGLETPERRLAAGKAREGTVRVTALHRSGRIVIEVADDGQLRPMEPPATLLTAPPYVVSADVA